MSKGSEELLESVARLLRTVGKAVTREGPVLRRAAGRILREDVGRRARKAARDIRRSGRTR